MHGLGWRVGVLCMRVCARGGRGWMVDGPVTAIRTRSFRVYTGPAGEFVLSAGAYHHQVVLYPYCTLVLVPGNTLNGRRVVLDLNILPYIYYMT